MKFNVSGAVQEFSVLSKSAKCPHALQYRLKKLCATDEIRILVWGDRNLQCEHDDLTGYTGPDAVQSTPSGKRFTSPVNCPGGTRAINVS
jgi:hypothetical protein